jgi:hypothetical protein
VSHIYRFGLASLHPLVSKALCGWASIGFVPDPVCGLAADKQQTCTIAGWPGEICRCSYGAVVPEVKAPMPAWLFGRVVCPEMKRFAYRVAIDSQWWGGMWRPRPARMLGDRNPCVAGGNEMSGLRSFGARGNAVDLWPRLPYIKEGRTFRCDRTLDMLRAPSPPLGAVP